MTWTSLNVCHMPLYHFPLRSRLNALALVFQTEDISETSYQSSGRKKNPTKKKEDICTTSFLPPSPLLLSTMMISGGSSHVDVHIL